MHTELGDPLCERLDLRFDENRDYYLLPLCVEKEN